MQEGCSKSNKNVGPKYAQGVQSGNTAQCLDHWDLNL